MFPDEEADENVMRPASILGVPDTLEIEVDPIVNAPVELEKIKSAEVEALPPRIPNKIWLSIHAVELGKDWTPNLPLKVDQSAEVRHPKMEAEAVAQVKAFPETVRPDP